MAPFNARKLLCFFLFLQLNITALTAASLTIRHLNITKKKELLLLAQLSLLSASVLTFSATGVFSSPYDYEKVLTPAFQQYSSQATPMVVLDTASINFFIMGIKAYKSERWQEAADAFTAAERYKLLGDYTLYYKADSLFRLKRYDDA